MEQPHQSVTETGEPSEPGRAPDRFQHTRWSLVRNAGSDDTEVARAALRELCELYWYPLYAFIRCTGQPAEDAKDQTQGFFADFLARGDFRQADPGRGKLRSFLIRAAKNYLSKQREKDRAQKRGGGIAPLSIDEALAEERFALEPADNLTPEKLYDRRWALTVLQEALAALRASYRGRGKDNEFETFLPFLSWNSGEDYDEAAATLRITVGAAKVAVHRMRKRYRAALIDLISDTVSSEAEIEEELSFLFTAFEN